MKFLTDIASLHPDLDKAFNIVETGLPTNIDVYFRAQQKEIIDQYYAARLFLREIETEDWNHWFKPLEDQQKNKEFELILSSYFYETALMYYNILVDLSWTICYVSVEFSCTQNGKRIEFSGMKSIE